MDHTRPSKSRNPLWILRAELDERPLEPIDPYDAHRVGIVLVVHGWGPREEEAVIALGALMHNTVVVNNDVLSHDRSESWCDGVIAHVRIANPSFAAACNAGVEHMIRASAGLPHKWLLFTQADARFSFEAIVTACRWSNTYCSDHGALATIGPSGGYLNGWPWPGPVVVVEYGRNVDPDCVARAVDFVAGYWLLAPMARLISAGAWDEAFALYYEDIDISLRLAMVGSRSIAVPTLDVSHERSATIATTHGHRSRAFLQAQSREVFVGRWERLCLEAPTDPNASNP